MDKVQKSVITCDMEGRIDTFNQGAVDIFGYAPDEVIGNKRVSAFSPGMVVLGHVTTWLKTAVEEGEFKGQTVFVRKDGTPFAAEVRITPTFRDGEQIGYCGVTTPLPDVAPESVMPDTELGTKVFAGVAITRAPFLTATIVPVLIGAAWVHAQGIVSPFPWVLFILALIGGVSMQVAANTFNDYFDWRSGTDPANNNYFLPFTGGSRSLELGLISERGLLGVAVIASLIASVIGVVIWAIRGETILAFGLFGLFSALFYTAPPLRLAARRGIGELLIGLNFGPLMVAGTAFVLTGRVQPLDFVVGIPVGLLTTAILWINEFPDTPSDIATGKLHLVATMGTSLARWGYLLLLAGAFGLTALGVVQGWLPVGGILAWLALPIAIYATLTLFRHYQERTLVRAIIATIGLQLVFGLIFATGLILVG